MKVDLETGEGVPFERIRRITGYLVGTIDRFNNAKAVELKNRVRHFGGSWDLIEHEGIITNLSEIEKNRKSDLIRIAGIVEDTVVDGPGLRLCIYTQGCPHRCKGCQNPTSHSYFDGVWLDPDTIVKTFETNTLLDGVSFSGGEPFEQPTVLGRLAKKIKELGKDVWCWTGYRFEYLLDNSGETFLYMDLLEQCDILIDGKFKEEQKNSDLLWRGSSNQRIIDVQKSLKAGKLLLAT